LTHRNQRVVTAAGGVIRRAMICRVRARLRGKADDPREAGQYGVGEIALSGLDGAQVR